MTSGDTLLVFTPLHNEPPSANFATLDTRNQHPVLDFEDGTDKGAVFSGVLPRNYAGGGITITLIWMAASATTGDTIWNISWERHEDDAFDLDADGFGSANQVVAPTANVSGEVSYDEIAFTDGVDMDSVAAGESFRLRVRRDADAGGDTMAGNAELLRVEIRET